MRGGKLRLGGSSRSNDGRRLSVRLRRREERLSGQKPLKLSRANETPLRSRGRRLPMLPKLDNGSKPKLLERRKMKKPLGSSKKQTKPRQGPRLQQRHHLNRPRQRPRQSHNQQSLRRQSPRRSFNQPLPRIRRQSTRMCTLPTPAHRQRHLHKPNQA